MRNSTNPEGRIPNPRYACLYRPPALDQLASGGTLARIAREFSPRYEQHGDDLVSIDVSGLERLFSARGHAEPRTCESEAKRQRQFAPGVGPPAPVEEVSACGQTPRSVWKTVGGELRREAAARGVRVHVAVAGTRMAALVLALARPGVTIVEPGEHAEALAPIPIGILEKIHSHGSAPPSSSASAPTPTLAVSVFKHWGLKTLGELAALPSADLAARLGKQGLVWQTMARGDDVRPLIPTLDEERFDASLELEWPIEGLEPLSFVLTRLLEPLSTRLERRDRGAAVLHVGLRLVTKDTHACRLELPAPMRDVRTLRTLALLDLEAHPPPAAIDRVTVVIDPTPGRVLQHTLFTRAHPTPEQVSTLLARLGAVMGQDRFGAPAVVDTYRPGAFQMAAFATEHDNQRRAPAFALLEVGELRLGKRKARKDDESRIPNPESLLVSALRRCRHPVPARVAVDHSRPVRVTTDRRGFVGGSVVTCAGPWRTSGEWWATGVGEAGGAGKAGGEGQDNDRRHPVLDKPHANKYCNRDEWDVALTDGAVYRIFQDRDTEAWFIDAIVD